MRALDAAAREAALRRLKLVAVNVVESSSEEDVFQRARDSAPLNGGVGLLRSLLRPVHDAWPQIPIQARIVPGVPESVLDLEAETADLLVLGTSTTGRRGTNLLLSDHVLVHVHRPTMVVR